MNEGYPENNLVLPAEWEPQWGVQLTWPHEDSDWNPYLKEITATYIEMARAITRYEMLLVVAPDVELVRQQLSEAEIDLQKVVFHQCPTNDTWARDHGFISCGVRSVECGVRSVECGVRSVECGVRSEECGVRSVE